MCGGRRGGQWRDLVWCAAAATSPVRQNGRHPFFFNPPLLPPWFFITTPWVQNSYPSACHRSKCCFRKEWIQPDCRPYLLWNVLGGWEKAEVLKVFSSSGLLNFTCHWCWCFTQLPFQISLYNSYLKQPFLSWVALDPSSAWKQSYLFGGSSTQAEESDPSEERNGHICFVRHGESVQPTIMWGGTRSRGQVLIQNHEGEGVRSKGLRT